MLIFFLFFCGNNQNFQDQTPFFLYTNSAIKEKIQEQTTFLCIYCGKIKNSIGTLPYDFALNNSRGFKNPNLFLIYVAETNQEKIKI
jgi:hypothetical protein